jgi:hypothetical protein
VLDALLHYDLTGFLTLQDGRNSPHRVRTLSPEAVVQGPGCNAEVAGWRRTRRCFAVSID